MKAVAIVLLALISGQVVVTANQQLLVGAVAKHAVAKAIGGAAAAGLASKSGALSNLPTDVLSKLKFSGNFSMGEPAGDLYCFPKYASKDVQNPVAVCPEGFNVNATALNKFACVKQVYVKSRDCFRSLSCPVNITNMNADKLCMPPEARSALIGILVVFHVKATLPVLLLPAIKVAMIKAVTFPITLPFKIATGATAVANGIKQAMSIAAAGADFAKALKSGADPMGLLTKSLMNINMTEVLNVAPQLNGWVSEQLEGITHVNNVTAMISAHFPSCLYKCCRDDISVDTTVTVPSYECPAGFAMNKILGVCVGSSAGYAPCPANMTQCPIPAGQPICIVNDSRTGLEACKALALLQPALLADHQCP